MGEMFTVHDANELRHRVERLTGIPASIVAQGNEPAFWTTDVDLGVSVVCSGLSDAGLLALLAPFREQWTLMSELEARASSMLGKRCPALRVDPNQTYPNPILVVDDLPGPVPDVSIEEIALPLFYSDLSDRELRRALYRTSSTLAARDAARRQVQRVGWEEFEKQALACSSQVVGRFAHALGVEAPKIVISPAMVGAAAAADADAGTIEVSPDLIAGFGTDILEGVLAHEMTHYVLGHRKAVHPGETSPAVRARDAAENRGFEMIADLGAIELTGNSDAYGRVLRLVGDVYDFPVLSDSGDSHDTLRLDDHPTLRERLDLLAREGARICSGTAGPLARAGFLGNRPALPGEGAHGALIA